MIEQQKYEAMWRDPQYRVASPGARAVDKFLEVADIVPGQTIRDLGCGTGRAGVRLAEVGMGVTQYDFANNCRDKSNTLPFVLHDLTEPIPGLPADWSFCADVLEHIPPEDVQKVIRHVVIAGRKCFLQICCVSGHSINHYPELKTKGLDYYGGELVDEDLHLTVKPYEWWKKQLEEFDCKIFWSETDGRDCAFLVTAYADAEDYAANAHINITHDELKDNIRGNLEHDNAEIEPYEVQDVTVMVLCGGPSLNDYADEIIERRKAGAPVVTVNNTHQWCREHGIEPSIHVMCDGREFNKRFIDPPFPRTKYLIASQCHPSVAASLPKSQVLLWHSGVHTAKTVGAWDLDHGRPLRAYYPINGGSTVTLRTLPLLHCLGFRKFELFGFDSCLRDGAHHAYKQPENDGKIIQTVVVGGREFHCQPWMIAQAGDFVKLARAYGDNFDLLVRGDGLISHIISSAAEGN